MFTEAKRALRKWVKEQGTYEKAAAVLGCPQSNLFVWANADKARPTVPWALVLDARAGIALDLWCDAKEAKRVRAAKGERAAA